MGSSGPESCVVTSTTEGGMQWTEHTVRLARAKGSS